MRRGLIYLFRFLSSFFFFFFQRETSKSISAFGVHSWSHKLQIFPHASSAASLATKRRRRFALSCPATHDVTRRRRCNCHPINGQRVLWRHRRRWPVKRTEYIFRRGEKFLKHPEQESCTLHTLRRKVGGDHFRLLPRLSVAAKIDTVERRLVASVSSV